MTASPILTSAIPTREFTGLILPRQGPCVSVLMPLYPAGDKKQHRILLKNLLAESRERLLARGVRASEADEILAGVRAKLTGFEQGANGTGGLALYGSPEGSTAVPLPFPARPLATVSDALFHVKPLFLLPLHTAEFFVLAISRNRVRVIQCTAGDATEIEIPDMPPDLLSAVPADDAEKRLQYRSLPHGTTRVHGHGAGKDSDPSRIQRYVRLIHRAFTKFTGGNHPYVVLAGVAEVINAYHTLAANPRVIAEPITGNADDVPVTELHLLARPLVERELEAQQHEAAEHCASLLKTGQWGAAANITTILRNASEGTVDTVFVAGDTELWGCWEPGMHQAVTGDQRTPDHDDLLNMAAVLAYRRSGTVHVRPRERMPGQNVAAATFRY